MNASIIHAKPSVVAEHNVRVLLEGEEWGQRRHTIAHIAPHQQPALRSHIVTEGQLGQIAAVECEQNAPQKAAQHNAARALI